MKRRSLLVERERLAGARDALAVERVAWKFQRPDPLADAARHLIQWRAVRSNGVPDANEANLSHLAIVGLVVILRQKQVAHRTEKILDVPNGVVPLAPVLPVGRVRLLVERRFILSGDQALIENQADHDADREGATAETESVDIVGVGAIIAARKFVDVDNIPLQAEAERAAKNCPRLER